MTIYHGLRASPCVETLPEMDVGNTTLCQFDSRYSSGFPGSTSHRCHSLKQLFLDSLPFIIMIAQAGISASLFARSMDCRDQAKSILAKTLSARLLTYYVRALLASSPIWLPHAILYSSIQFLFRTYIYATGKASLKPYCARIHQMITETVEI